ncbi:conserved hypothetical protein [Paenibacillus curdlanolyticus YK9]|uniref:LiaF transmembrane domain-containing protein n=1 Tax=Paenibacillus curdlanolyticus YK9 TaxID=717606 RepID=E0I6Y8_9BACL|nr:hypothetical protein [Paenibacillus curdlanolyticus]EFM11804.1 conserved hypothetical protein [Paenibacillus curdlanolyticus YK9]
MNIQSKKGLVLIAIGAVIALPIIGFSIGWVLKLLFPFILVGLGVVGWRNGNRIFGGLLIGFGGLMVLGKFHTLIMLIIAIALVAYGVSLVKGRRS